MRMPVLANGPSGVIEEPHMLQLLLTGAMNQRVIIAESLDLQCCRLLKHGPGPTKTASEGRGLIEVVALQNASCLVGHPAVSSFTQVSVFVRSSVDGCMVHVHSQLFSQHACMTI